MPEIDWSSLLRDFVTLLVVIDPIGSLPVFFYATAHVPRALHWRFALTGVLAAGVVLLFFLVAGQFLLEGLGLRLGSFQIAGGLVLFLFAMTMIFGDSKPAREIEEASHEEHLAGAIFPLAMPSIASPGAILAVVILTDNHRHSVAEQAQTAGVLLIVLILTFLVLLAGVRLKRYLGLTGAGVISRVMGIILATVAVDAVLGGLEAVGVLRLVPSP